MIQSGFISGHKGSEGKSSSAASEQSTNIFFSVIENRNFYNRGVSLFQVFQKVFLPQHPSWSAGQLIPFSAAP